MTKSVMLVEYEDCLARAMTHLVTGDGHRCARLAPGDRIMDRVTAEQPDLLLLDMAHCDRTDAMAACQSIRRSEGLDGVKILVLHMSDGELERRRSLGLGADGVLRLPAPMAQLRDEMRRLLQEPAPGREV